MVYQAYALAVIFLALNSVCQLNGMSQQEYDNQHPQNRYEFFAKLMGGNESDFCSDLLADRGAHWIQYTPGANTFKAVKSGKTYTCGTYVQKSVNDLRIEASSINGIGGGTISVVSADGAIKTTYHGNRFSDWTETTLNPYLYHVDVGALQADPANNGAVFLVASNFNGLETVHYKQSIDIKAHKIDSYPGDTTQGPAASVSAAPGLIWRRYLVYADKNRPMKEWAQRGEFSKWNTHAMETVKFENFLDQTEIAGFVTPAGYPKLPDHQQQPSANQFSKIKIGWHENIQVTFGHIRIKDKSTDNKHLPCTKADQRVHQVFAAAINLDGTNKKEIAAHAAWAKLCLEAAVEGCLLAAIVKFNSNKTPLEKRKVFLTPIGCGVFANELPWFSAAIAKCTDLIIMHGLQVTVINFQMNPNNSDPYNNQLKTLVTQTGGRYRAYTPEQPEGFDLIAAKQKTADPTKVNTTTLGSSSKVVSDPQGLYVVDTINTTALTLVQANITALQFPQGSRAAIVNAANKNLNHDGGVAGAISQKDNVIGRCLHDPTDPSKKPKGPGEAMIVPVNADKWQGQNITHIIHAVGPDCRTNEKNNFKETLRRAYVTSLELATAQKLTAIAFPSISTNIFECDQNACNTIAVDTVTAWLQKNQTTLQEVRFVTFNDDLSIPGTIYRAYKTLLETKLADRPPQGNAGILQPAASSSVTKALCLLRLRLLALAHKIIQG